MRRWIVKFEDWSEVQVDARTESSARNKAKRTYPQHGEITNVEAV